MPIDVLVPISSVSIWENDFPGFADTLYYCPMNTQAEVHKHTHLSSYSFIPARGRPGKVVQMTEAEVRCLCIKSRELFLSQPILLELEAPLKICGKTFNFLIQKGG